MIRPLPALRLLLGLFLAPLAIASLNQAHATEIIPTRTVTANGMTVLFLEQHFLPTVEIHALIKVGSAQDPPDKAGLANLTASLLDEGTTTRTSRQMAEQIDFVGGSIGANATEDFTTASARVLKKDADLGFTLLADMLQHPAFHKQEFERVRAQILGEIVSDDDDPGNVAMKAFHQLIFHGHPYSWPTHGTEDTLNKITVADVQQFHAKEYVPNQTILVVVGDLTQEQATALVQTHFGSWKRGPSTLYGVKRPAPLDRKMVQLIEKDLTQSTIVLGHTGISRSNPDYYAVTVMNYILGAGGFSSRLMDSIRDKQGLAYGIMSQFDTRLMPGAFLINLQTRTEFTNQAITGVLTELKGIRDAAVTDQELSEAKSFTIGSFPLRVDSSAKLAKVLAQVEFYNLGLDYFTQYPKAIEKVTKDDVQRVAKQYLDPQHYALVVVGSIAKAKVKQ
ncbi:insulinase family protein [Nitrospirales bacterium NOB]|mgnify:CR=1 FL=1|nr:putative zinc protease [Nitrospirota bacterium]MCE7965582.1 insulinase family protein [Nitrospira sp. NTP2]MCK6492205.1 insulinase family protein [Nitrospira sp.]MDL1889813.1 insulinase family protein [Nitrospirales bacterium NOB]QOJ36013.1 MAG: insulinase family protein [Nitrospira sp.]